MLGGGGREGVKEQGDAVPMGEISPGWNKRDKANPVKRGGQSHIKKKRREMGGQRRGRGGAADAREYLRRAAGIKREGSAEPNRNKKEWGINKSIQVHNNTIYSDICHMYYWPGWTGLWPRLTLLTPCSSLCSEMRNRAHTGRGRTTAESKDFSGIQKINK